MNSLQFNRLRQVLFGFSIVALIPIIFLLGACARSAQERAAKFLQSGQHYLEAKDFDRAVIEFRNAVQANPKDAESHYQLGLAYLGTGDIQGSIGEFQQTVSLSPGHRGAELKLAEFMSASTDPELIRQGKAKAEGVLRDTPGNSDALQTLAVAELRLDDPKEAIRHLEEALTKTPAHLSSSVTLANIKLRDGDAAGAEAVMEKTAASAPSSPEHALALAYIYLQTQNVQRAESELRRSLQLNPRFGPAMLGLGSLLLRQGDTAEAGKWLQQASALPDKQYRPLYATFLFQTGQTDRAITEFQKLHESDPQNRDLRTRLVSILLASGRKNDAVAVLRDALTRNQKDTEALIQRAEIHLLNENYQEARTDTTTVLSFRPDSAVAHYFMGRIHAAQNAPASQIQELAEAVRLDPRLLAARLALAHAYSTSKSANSAMQILDQASPEEKKNLSYIVERNITLYQMGDIPAVRKGIDQGLAMARDPSLLLQDGLLKISDKKYASARASLEEVLTQHPQEWRAVQAIAQSYVAEKKNEEAIAAVRKHAAASPNSAEGQKLLGSWLARSGDVQGARAAFTHAKALAPNSIESDLALGDLALTERKFDEARQEFSAALVKAPDTVAALLGLAVAEERAGRVAAATSYYEQVLKKDPQNVQSMNNLAYLLADTQANPDRALTLAQKAKELAPDNSSIDDTLGWAYYNKGLYKSSLEYLKRAAINGSPKRNCHLAMAYIRLGEKTLAIDLVQSALSKDPNLPEAKRVLDLLAQAR